MCVCAFVRSVLGCVCMHDILCSYVCVKKRIKGRLIKCVLIASSHKIMHCMYCALLIDFLTFNGPFSLFWCYPKELVNLAKKERQLVLLHVGRLHHRNDIQLLLGQLSYGREGETVDLK